MDETMGAFVRAEIDRYLDEHDLKLVRLAIHDGMERRAICLKMAIEAKGFMFSLRDDASASAVADAVVFAAKRFETYVAGSGHETGDASAQSMAESHA